MEEITVTIPAGRIAVLFLLILCIIPVPAGAKLVGPKTARTVAENRLTHHLLEFGHWAGESDPKILTAEEIRLGDTLVGYNFLISPKGHILVPADDGLPPVKLSSDKSTLSFGINGEGDEDASRPELREWVTDALYHAVRGLEGFDAPLAEVDENIRASRNELWALYMTDSPIFPDALEDFGDKGKITSTGPLLKTAWEQDAPYNLFNPEDREGCRTRAGEAPVALAQVMKFFDHPDRGRGEYIYEWKDGPRTATLRRNFAESTFFWKYMPKSISSSSTAEEKNSVAGLTIDTGVALSTQFGCEQSRAGILQAPAALRDFFGYPEPSLVSRGDLNSDTEWIRMLGDEFQAGRPILFEVSSSSGKTVSAVGDGIRSLPDQLHLNIALDRNYRGWLAFDHILLGDSNPADARNHRAVIKIERPMLGPAPISPKPGDTVVNASQLFTFSEPPNNDYTHYNLWIKGPSGPFGDDWAVRADICSDVSCAMLPAVDLPEPGEYQWAVRGYKDEEGSVPGRWSEPVTFFARKPGTPNLLSPEGNITSPPVQFSWSAVNGSYAYVLAISSGNASFPDIMVDPDRACVNASCSAILTNLGKGNYTWSVHAEGIGRGNSSRMIDFTVLNNAARNRTRSGNATEADSGNITGPPPPSLVSPENGTVIGNPRPVFSWLPEPDATDYMLIVNGPLGLAERPEWIPATLSCSLKLCAGELNASLDPDGNYTWFVRAKTGNDFGKNGVQALFTVRTRRPADMRFTASPPETTTLKATGPDEPKPEATGPPAAEASPPASSPAPASPTVQSTPAVTTPPAQAPDNNTPLIRTRKSNDFIPIEERPKKILNIRKKGKEIPEGNQSRKPLLRIKS